MRAIPPKRGSMRVTNLLVVSMVSRMAVGRPLPDASSRGMNR